MADEPVVVMAEPLESASDRDAANYRDASMRQLEMYVDKAGLSPLVGCSIAERYTLFCQPLGLVHVHLELPHRGIAIVRGIAIARGLQWLGHNNNRLVGHDRNNKK
jgi:hypothetical protein